MLSVPEDLDSEFMTFYSSSIRDLPRDILLIPTTNMSVEQLFNYPQDIYYYR